MTICSIDEQDKLTALTSMLFCYSSSYKLIMHLKMFNLLLISNLKPIFLYQCFSLTIRLETLIRKFPKIICSKRNYVFIKVYLIIGNILLSELSNKLFLESYVTCKSLVYIFVRGCIPLS